MNSIALSLTELQAIADYLAGGTGGNTGGGTGGDGGGGTVDGQALYTSNCAACHGADAATINDQSVSGITAAMTSIGSMTGITLNAAEIQAIADYLAGGSGGGTGGGGGDTGGGGLPPTHTNSEEGVLHADGNNYPYTNGCTACHGATLQGAIGPSCFACHGQEWNESPPSGGGDTGGGSGTIDGQALYSANCSGCHGADGSSINGRSVSEITAAINNLGIMSSISLSAAELQAISDFLTGNTGSGGNTGGGDTGGGSGTVDGQALYSANCSGCHGADGSSINGRSVSEITAAINNLGIMSSISLSAAELQAISDFLTGNTGSGGNTGGGDTGGGSGTVDGQALYTSACAACHGATGSSINNNTASGITAAMTSIGSMTGINLTAAEIQAIADFLGGTSGGGGDTGGGSGGLPTNHTNSEDGILHAPGNNYPYTNGCTTCHGSSLQGAIGPSCFACHGAEWNENPPSHGAGSSGGSGGTATGGQALYTSYCAACHGATGSNINGRTASAISSAIANIGSMNGISLTSTDIQAIADYLAGSTGSGGSGDGGSSGLPANHTNSEEGVLHASGNNYPYANGCTSCHGSDLRGGVGPSCFACHGQEWQSSGSSSGSGDGSREEDD